jgi:hypothetical protein
MVRKAFFYGRRSGDAFMQVKAVFRLITISLLTFMLFAFVEPLPLLFNKMELKMRGWNVLTVEGDRTVLDPLTGVRVRQSFQLTLTRPDGIRLDVLDPASGESIVDPLPPYIKQAMTMLLLSQDKAALFNQLKQWGVRAEPLGLARLDGVICVVVGAYENQLLKAQIWVDKFDYFPMRLITVASIGQTAIRTDARLSGWQNPVGGGFFPAQIEFFRDDTLQESWTISGVDTRAR